MGERPIAVVVDESKPFLMYLSRLLNRMDLEVLPVNQGGEALEIARVTHPQLLTLDMRLPDMDGLELLRNIRADRELTDLPVIMITSYQEKSRQWEALSLGCIDVVDKPVDLRRLHKAIRRCNFHPGGGRRYLRAPFEKRVSLYHQGKHHEVASSNLSERGIFLHLDELLPKGARVEVELPLPSDARLRVGGAVIYSRQERGEPSVSSGTAIKFDRLTQQHLEIIATMIAELLIGDIVAEQTEPFVSPNR